MDTFQTRLDGCGFDRDLSVFCSVVSIGDHSFVLGRYTDVYRDSYGERGRQYLFRAIGRASFNMNLKVSKESKLT